MDKDSKGQMKMEDSGGGLLPAVEGHSLEKNRNKLSFIFNSFFFHVVIFCFCISLISFCSFLVLSLLFFFVVFFSCIFLSYFLPSFLSFLLLLLLLLFCFCFCFLLFFCLFFFVLRSFFLSFFHFLLPYSMCLILTRSYRTYVEYCRNTNAT